MSVDTLHVVAQKLTSPIAAEREAGEDALLKARHDAIPALIQLLSSSVPAGGVSPVARAALLLGALGARDAVPSLISLVENGVSKEVRPFIARALKELLDGSDAFDDRARAAVEKLASDDDNHTRAFAAECFFALGDVRSKARVQALAQDKDPFVRDKAQATLRRFLEAEGQNQNIGVDDFAALVQQAESEGGVLKPWLMDLGDHRRQVRDVAVNELVKAGRKSVPFLIDKLNQPHARARIGAAFALGRLQAPEAAGPLLVAATLAPHTSEESELRPIALRALANCLTGVEEGLSASLLPLARDSDRFVRAGALLCLGRLADRAGMRAVVQAVLEDDPFVVESAAIALSEGVRDDDAALVPALLAALGKRPEPKAAVKEAILIALSRIVVDGAPLRVRIRHRVRRDVLGATASTRKAAIVLLERLFEQDDPPPLSLLDDVLSRLSDEHPEVRLVAASFLARHLEPGMTGAERKLQTAIGREERTLSLLCLDALRRHDTKDAGQVLAVAARSGDEEVVKRANDILASFSPTTEPWTFTPKTPLEQKAPGRTESQRPTPVSDLQRPRRVRAAQGAQTGDVVDAKDATVPPTGLDRPQE